MNSLLTQTFGIVPAKDFTPGGASGSPNRCGITTVCPRATTSSANAITSGVIPGSSWTTITPVPLPLRYVGWVVSSAVCSPRVQLESRLMPPSCDRLLGVPWTRPP